MKDKKMYSAFVSSVFESLRDERSTVIDCLLDNKVFPVCMEHFTVSTSGKFSDIEEKIDDSDFFILLLGKHYGSQDDEGVSWTEREYDYAVSRKKEILVLICDELAENRKKDYASLSKDEQCQVDFANKISFARTVTDELTIPKIMRQYFSQIDFHKLVGWTRNADLLKEEEAKERWREEHKAYDISGNWYHVHLSEDDEAYIRVGSLKILQNYDRDTYHTFEIEGINHSVKHYDESANKLCEDVLKCSRFKGEYKMSETGEVFGIFRAKRGYNGTFGDQAVGKGERRGIHDFTIDVSGGQVSEFDGEFHDEAPSPKQGRIFVFRREEDRLQFLLDVRGDVLPRK